MGELGFAYRKLGSCRTSERSSCQQPTCSTSYKDIRGQFMTGGAKIVSSMHFNPDFQGTYALVHINPRYVMNTIDNGYLFYIAKGIGMPPYSASKLTVTDTCKQLLSKTFGHKMG